MVNNITDAHPYPKKMKKYSGPFLTRDGFVQAEITVLEDTEEGQTSRIVDYVEGGDTGDEAIIIPALFNSHTHMGDSVVGRPPKGSIPEIVGPGGYKHKALSEATDEELIRAMKGYLERAYGYGVRYIMDFREGGLKGLTALERAREKAGVEMRVYSMARPPEGRWDKTELREILKRAYGMGLSSYRDFEPDDIRAIATETRDMGKPLAMHCSEHVREPLDEVLDLGVHHLVHMIEADKEDFSVCAENNVPVVVCPRSNIFFRKVPDIPAMLDAGITLCLGTDNAMLSSSNMLREMEAAYRVAKLKGDVEPLDILMMSTCNPRKALNPPSDMGTKSRDCYMIIKGDARDPAYEVVTRTSTKDIIAVAEW